MNRLIQPNLISIVFIFCLILSISSGSSKNQILSYDLELDPYSAFENPNTLSYEDYSDDDYLFPSIWLYSINMNDLDEINLHEIMLTFSNLTSALSLNIIIRSHLYGVVPGETSTVSGQSSDIVTKRIEDIRGGNILIKVDQNYYYHSSSSMMYRNGILLDNYRQIEVFLFFSSSDNPTDIININIQAWRSLGTIEGDSGTIIDISNTDTGQKRLHTQIYDFIISNKVVFIALSLGITGSYVGNKILTRYAKAKQIPEVEN